MMMPATSGLARPTVFVRLHRDEILRGMSDPSVRAALPRIQHVRCVAGIPKCPNNSSAAKGPTARCGL